MDKAFNGTRTALAVSGVLLLMAGSGVAGTKTWTGGTPGEPGCNNFTNVIFWSVFCNWSSEIAPVANDDLVFPATGHNTSSNNYAAGTVFETITIGGGHQITGNGIVLSRGLTAAGGIVALDSIKLNHRLTFTAPTDNLGAIVTSAIDNNGNTLEISGPGDFQFIGLISGSSGVLKAGTGTTTLEAANTYSGKTIVEGGTLFVNGSQPAGIVAFAEGVLGGTGTVGPIIVSVPLAGHAAKIKPGIAGPGILNCKGLSVVAGNFPELVIELNNTGAGTGYDQLNVTGTVNLAGEIFLVPIRNPNFIPSPGDTFIVINNDGTDPVTGTFKSFPEGFSFVDGPTTFFVSYHGGDGNDVVLHVPATRTWDGQKDDGTASADNKWRTKENWVGDIAPTDGDSLLFPDDAVQKTNTNDFPVGTTFTSIAFTGGDYILGGNQIVLNAGITSSSDGNRLDIEFGVPVMLAADQTFKSENSSISINATVMNNGHRLSFAGSDAISVFAAISGAGGLTKQGLGTAVLRQNIYTGVTNLEEGRLEILHDQPGTSAVNMTGGMLSGDGRIGALTASGGTILPGSGFGTLSINGNLNLSSQATLRIFISGTDVATQYNQLSVTGAVNLDNAALTATLVGSFVPNLGDTFVIIDNDGTDAIVGTFNGLAEGAVFNVNEQLFQITYKGGEGNNDVVLTRIERPFPSPSPTPMATPEATATATSTPKANATATATPEITATPGASATPTGTPKATATPNATATATASPTPTPGLVANVSTRLPVGTGDNALIEGFIVQGPSGSMKKILVRAIGPSLKPFGIPDALANPTLGIFNSNNSQIAFNDNWKTTQVSGIITSSQVAEINGSKLAPSNDFESAIIANLTPESYTAVVRGAGNTVGTGVVDAFDLSAASTARVANISTRGLIQPGDKLMIAGFIVQNGSVRVVISAIGPSLTAFGIPNALPDTTLQLRDQNGVLVRENDDWMTSQKQELETTGLQPSNPKEAALVATIPPGQYTAQVRGKPESTGIGVVQVYFLQ